MVYKTHHPHQMSQKYCSGLIYEVVVYERLIFAQTFETTITCTTPNSIILSKLMHHVKTNFRSSILTIIQSKTMPTIMTLMQTTSMSSVLLSDQPNGCLSFGFVQTTVVPIFQLFINIFQFIETTMTRESVELSRIESWVVMKFLFLQRKIWDYDINPGWQIPPPTIIFNRRGFTIRNATHSLGNLQYVHHLLLTNQ